MPPIYKKIFYIPPILSSATDSVGGKCEIEPFWTAFTVILNRTQVTSEV